MLVREKVESRLREKEGKRRLLNGNAKKWTRWQSKDNTMQ